MRQAARRPAFRWYSEAVLSSSAAPDVSTAMDDIFDSMLSEKISIVVLHKCSKSRRTYHVTLGRHKCAQVMENLRKLMYPSLDFSNFFLPFLDKRFLVSELMR